jgi:RNA polymerase sigma-70 factor (ECF subfamily)
MQIEEVLEQAFAAGRAAWPTVQIERARYVEHVTAANLEPENLLARAGDVYLAVACAAQSPVALACFEQAFLRSVTRQLGRIALGPDEEDELKQRLRVKLLVGAEAKIREYRASGPLGAWVRVCALRLALDLAAPESLRRDDSQALDELVAPQRANEVTFDAGRHREAFREALHDALGSLNAREKTILRLHFLEGMNIDALGTLFQVHRATVARWLVTIRTGVLEHVRKRLGLEIGASPSEAQSLVRLLGSDVHLSIQRLLTDEGGTPEGR